MTQRYHAADTNGTTDWNNGKFLFCGEEKIGYLRGTYASEVASAMEEKRYRLAEEAENEKHRDRAKEYAQELINKHGYPQETLYFLSTHLIHYFTADYSDSLRIARADDPKQVQEYQDTISCCGSVDLAQPVFLQDGGIVVMMFGYNYGH